MALIASYCVPQISSPPLCVGFVLADNADSRTVSVSTPASSLQFLYHDFDYVSPAPTTCQYFLHEAVYGMTLPIGYVILYLFLIYMYMYII